MLVKVLLVVATALEIEPLIDQWVQSGARKSEHSFVFDSVQVDVLITGPGMMLTAFALGSHLRGFDYDFLLNAGIAGSMDQSLALGDVVQVHTEQFGDFGAEDQNQQLLDVFQLELINAQQHPFQNGKLVNQATQGFSFLPTVEALTVNRVHGSSDSIARMRNQFPDAQIESMEGAAFFYSALLYEKPFLQIRSISNYVEPRNRDAWQIGLAVNHLCKTLSELIGAL